MNYWDKPHLVLMQYSLYIFLDIICYNCAFAFMRCSDTNIHFMFSPHQLLVSELCGPHKTSWEISLFSKRIFIRMYRSLYYFSLKCLIKFPTEVIWFWIILIEKFLITNLLHGYSIFHIFYFFQSVCFGKLYLSNNLSISSKLPKWNIIKSIIISSHYSSNIFFRICSDIHLKIPSIGILSFSLLI